LAPWGEHGGGGGRGGGREGALGYGGHASITNLIAVAFAKERRFEEDEGERNMRR